MNITIIGCGYVGLVSGTCLSDIGHNVICIDINKNKINSLKKGIIPIYEDGLEKMIAFNTKKKRLSFTTSYKEAISHSDIIFLCVDTPSNKDGTADLTSIKNTCVSISKHMTSNKIIVEKSSVPVGTSDMIHKIISTNLRKNNKKLNFDVVSNPEFLKEGSAINDFIKPDRIIIGIDNSRLKPIFDEIYLPFNRKFDKIQYMDIKSAELTKYAANAMLATKISFMNEMSRLSEKLGADIEQVRLGIGSDSRIGYEFIYPGCGYGGSCFPKDIRGAIKTAEHVGYDMKILKAVNEVNNKQKEVLFEKLTSHFDNNLKGKKISIWGLSFKPGTNDLREAPSLVLINSILKAGGEVFAHDPEAATECKKIYSSEKNFNIESDHYACLENSEALIICTEWKIYRQVDLQRLKDLMIYPVIIDGRNIFSKKLMFEEKISYISIGRN